MTIQELMKQTVGYKASDLHLSVGSPPVVRIHGQIKLIPDTPVLTVELMEQLVVALLSPKQKETLWKTRELDFSVSSEGAGRFRANAFWQRGTLGLALRSISEKIPTIEQLKLPAICKQFATLKQGFVLVTGPTGSGKSSTLAAVMGEINRNRSEHILTIEDPIEFIYKNEKSVVIQRELGSDTLSWGAALKAALREDPDVVLVGEMRDPETMQAAITIAETGHLVFATLHTNSAAQTIDRIVDSFGQSQQNQVRMQLSNALEAVFSQRLIPTADGSGRIVAAEVLVATPAVKNTIREGKTHQLDSIIQTSSEMGMMTLETSLAYWVKQGTITMDKAREFSLRPADLIRLVGRK